MNKCSLCGNKHFSKGLCELHYRRFSTWGDPYFNNNEWLKNNRGTCKIDDCSNIHQSLGLCQSHYDKQRHKNNPEYDRERSKIYRKNNLEKCKKVNRMWHHKNREKNNKRTKQYHKDHPEVILKAKKKQLEKLGKTFDLNSSEYLFAIQSWAKTIKKLDNHMCKNCDSTENLNAHHIMPKAEYPELSLDLDNGVTLCEDCHGPVHGFELY